MTLFEPGPALPTIADADLDTITRDDARALLAMRHEMACRAVNEQNTPKHPNAHESDVAFYWIEHQDDAFQALPYQLYHGDPAAALLAAGITTEEHAHAFERFVTEAKREHDWWWMHRAGLDSDSGLPINDRWAINRDNAYICVTGKQRHIDATRCVPHKPWGKRWKYKSKFLALVAHRMARKIIERRDGQQMQFLKAAWMSKARALAKQLAEARSRYHKICRLIGRATEPLPEPEEEPDPWHNDRMRDLYGTRSPKDALCR